MFGKKVPKLTAASMDFEGTKVARGLMLLREAAFADAKVWAQEMNIKMASDKAETPLEALESAADVLVSQRFLSLIAKRDFQYVDGTSTDVVPGAVALAVIHIMLSEIEASLEEEGFKMKEGFSSRVAASSLLSHLRFFPEAFQREVYQRAAKLALSLWENENSSPNVAEMLRFIRTLTLASIVKPPQLHGQEEEIDRVFSSIYQSLLSATERGPSGAP